MKQLAILITLILLTVIKIYSQDDLTYRGKLLSIRERTIPQEYSISFKKDDERRSFKLLREFLKQKETELAKLELELGKIELDEEGNYIDTDTTVINKYENQIEKLQALIKGKPAENTEVKVPYPLLNDPDIFYTMRRYKDSVVSITAAEVNTLISDKRKIMDEIRLKITAYQKAKKIIEASISNVNEDITLCTRQIDSALAPEYQQQDFRKIISISFSVLIGLLLTIFFCIVYKRSDTTLSKDLLSGNGLQFITLFVLIIAVILFGILNILGSSELAAILSGISGYILGKGTQKDLTTVINASNMNQQHNP